MLPIRITAKWLLCPRGSLHSYVAGDHMSTIRLIVSKLVLKVKTEKKTNTNGIALLLIDINLHDCLKLYLFPNIIHTFYSLFIFLAAGCKGVSVTGEKCKGNMLVD